MSVVRVALAQLNLRVGDLDGNVERILTSYDAAAALDADVVAFPELAVTAYPPEDLLLRPSFVHAASEALGKVVAHTGAALAVLGHPERLDDGSLANAATVAAQGRTLGVYRKQLLPNYSVFDERRYFVPGSDDGPFFDVAGVRMAVSICEDVWSADGPVPRQATAGAGLVVNVNASPFYAGRAREREAMLAERARQAGVPIAYVNLVGGQDDLVFDGGSVVVDASGAILSRAHQFAEDLLVVDLEVSGARAAPAVRAAARSVVGPPRVEPLRGEVAEVYEALALGTRDYIGKGGFPGVVIGLSGGIDSSLVAAIATDALGPERVLGVRMPSRHSSEGSLTDAAELAERLGIALLTIPIESAHAAFEAMLAEAFAGTGPGIAEENLQARIRGTLLMALSNKRGWLVLTTGNKSEIATGYSTLYGDMAGGFSVLKDVPKTLVYALAHARNARAGYDLIPRAVLEKAPSAELRPDQRDEDSLPRYEVLDRIVESYVELDRSVAEIAAEGFDLELVRQVARLVDSSEHKRRQAPPGPRVSPKAFGKDRRLPITSGWST